MVDLFQDPQKLKKLMQLLDDADPGKNDGVIHRDEALRFAEQLVGFSLIRTRAILQLENATPAARMEAIQESNFYADICRSLRNCPDKEFHRLSDAEIDAAVVAHKAGKPLPAVIPQKLSDNELIQSIEDDLLSRQPQPLQRGQPPAPKFEKDSLPRNTPKFYPR